MADDDRNEKDRGKDDLRERFPDPDTDSRLQVPRGDTLPDVPQVEFERPRFPQPDPNAPGTGFRNLPGELRGAGAASTIGITLVASIAVGTGLGWLVDRFLLGQPATPWGLIVGFLLGTTSGFINLIRVANRLERENERGDRQQRG